MPSCCCLGLDELRISFKERLENKINKDEVCGPHFNEIDVWMFDVWGHFLKLAPPRFKGIEQESIKSATLNLRPYKLQNTE